MVSSRERKHAEALELARAAGWRSPSEVAELVAALPDPSTGTARVAALEAQLTDHANRLAVMVEQVHAWRAATGCTLPGEAKLEREQLEKELAAARLMRSSGKRRS